MPQLYVAPPFAVKMEVLPGQTLTGFAAAFAEGFGKRVTTVVAVAVQPAALVTVTV